jgi:hypothetical protein
MILRWSVAVGVSVGLWVMGAGPGAAAQLKPHWRHVADTSGVLAGSRYVFIDKPFAADGSPMPGGTLIDEQTGEERSIVPPVPAGYECDPGAEAIGGPWLAFLCWVPSQTTQPVVFQIELYRIATRRWSALQAVSRAPVLGIGADWIEYWVPHPNATYPQFVFQDIDTGHTRTLAEWRPGGGIVPNLNFPSLSQRLCAPVRVPTAWQGTREDWPGTVSVFGRYAIAGGVTRKEQASAIWSAAGRACTGGSGPSDRWATLPAPTRMPWCGRHRRSRLTSRGPYLPNLKRFTINTTNLVNSVTSSYTGQNTYSSWLTSRTLYLLVTPYSPSGDPMMPSGQPQPSRLFAAPAPRQPHRR